MSGCKYFYLFDHATQEFDMLTQKKNCLAVKQCFTKVKRFVTCNLNLVIIYFNLKDLRDILVKGEFKKKKINK